MCVPCLFSFSNGKKKKKKKKAFTSTIFIARAVYIAKYNNIPLVWENDFVKSS